MPKEQAASVSMDNQHVTENYSKSILLICFMAERLVGTLLCMKRFT